MQNLENEIIGFGTKRTVWDILVLVLLGTAVACSVVYSNITLAVIFGCLAGYRLVQFGLVMYCTIQMNRTMNNMEKALITTFMGKEGWKEYKKAKKKAIKAIKRGKE